MNLGDMRVINGAQRGGELPRQDTSLWSQQLTARVILRNIPRNIVARKREVSAGHRVEIMEQLLVVAVDGLLAQRKIPGQ